MRTLAKNMAFLMKSIALGKEAYGLPKKEAPVRTNFIRQQKVVVDNNFHYFVVKKTAKTAENYKEKSCKYLGKGL